MLITSTTTPLLPALRASAGKRGGFCFIDSISALAPMTGGNRRLRADLALATRVLRIFIDSIERSLRVCCAAPPSARPGAVSFLQRFGSALNEHWHYHCCVSAGVFDTADDGSLRFVFATIDAQSVAQVQARVRRQVLAAYRRRGWLDAVSAANMAEWNQGGGLSVDASVAIHGSDRAGLERLLRYCARPCWRRSG